ncbi:MAG: tripartite tricarboxylate transporter substrate binding protein [Proteobacteria bacterium]|nr:tripartite tricarboxylate transporter substrate binding protein [Pseudomonadota bacterium]
MDRRIFTTGMMMLGAVLPTAASAQAAWPERPVRIIVASTPGSSPDALARLLGKELEAKFGQPFIVENKPGAGGIVGSETLANAAPDGYTFGIAHDGMMAINTVLYKNLSYDPTKDFAAVAPLAVNEFVLIANAGTGVKTFADFTRFVKEKAGSVTYASAGNGTPNHVFMEQLLQKLGAKALHVPYKGGAAAVADVAGGQAQFMLAGIAPALPVIRAGKVNAVAVTQGTRSKMLPDAATIAETIPGFALETWFGFFAPAGTPPAIITRMNTELRAILARPDFVKALNDQGIMVKTGTAEAMMQTVRDDIVRYQQLAKTIKLEAQ